MLASFHSSKVYLTFKGYLYFKASFIFSFCLNLMFQDYKDYQEIKEHLLADCQTILIQ